MEWARAGDAAANSREEIPYDVAKVAQRPGKAEYPESKVVEGAASPVREVAFGIQASENPKRAPSAALA